MKRKPRVQIDLGALPVPAIAELQRVGQNPEAVLS
jgi:hypothetical protein